jgi:hypothetical protein
VPHLEQAEEWEAHLTATMDDLGPSGYLEVALAERVALLLWRLGRVARYEQERTSARQDRAESEQLHDRQAADAFNVSSLTFGRIKY